MCVTLTPQLQARLEVSSFPPRAHARRALPPPSALRPLLTLLRPRTRDTPRASPQHLESTIVWPVAEGAAVEDADDDDDAEAAAPDGKAAVNGH